MKRDYRFHAKKDLHRNCPHTYTYGIMNRLEDYALAIATMVVFIFILSCTIGIMVALCYCTRRFCYRCKSKRKDSCVCISTCKVNGALVDYPWHISAMENKLYNEQHVTFKRIQEEIKIPPDKTMVAPSGILNYCVKRPHPPFTLYENNTQRVKFFESQSSPSEYHTKEVTNFGKESTACKTLESSSKYTNLVVSKNCDSCTLVVRCGTLRIPM